MGIGGHPPPLYPSSYEFLSGILVARGFPKAQGLWLGDIAQLGERGVRNAEVGGSSPPISTSKPL